MSRLQAEDTNVARDVLAWCEVHHILAWEDDGETALHNCVMLCKYHHRLLHRASEWQVRIRDGLPEFIPPGWIDPERRPRRRPLPYLVA
ncbi:MAG: HNH endonuclease signature motif containing protein [Pseudonocardia sp.]